MESLTKFNHVNLPTILIENMHKVMTIKDGRHGLAYGFLLNPVFTYFNVQYRPCKKGSVKKIFTLSTLEDNECIAKKIGVKSKSIVAYIFIIQT